MVAIKELESPENRRNVGAYRSELLTTVDLLDLVSRK